MSKFFQGASYFTQGFPVLLQPGFRLFLLVPLIVNIALFVGFIAWAKSMYDGWMAYLMGWLPEWLGFLEWFFWLIYLVAIVMVIFYGFVASANFLGAPFYGYLSELLEEKLRGESNEQGFNWKDFLALVPRTVIREIQKLMYYLPRVLGLFVLGLIPGINALAAVAWIGFSAWMMAIQYLDYPADNNGLSFREMRDYLGNNRSTAFGFGIMAFCCTLIPVLNFVALPAAVCGATIFWVDNHHPLQFKYRQSAESQERLSQLDAQAPMPSQGNDR